MATYAIGDIQGCFDSLSKLISYIGFDPRTDRLWLVGDLVNRGPKSLEVLRFVRDLGDRATCVLGNHDMHLLCQAAGISRHKKRDTLQAVLEAPDRDELIDWLRHRPVMHVEDGQVLVHAGLHPDWTIDDARALADEICARLRAPDWRDQISVLKSKKKTPAWARDLSTKKRLRAASSVFFTMRACRADGTLCEDFAGPIDQTPDDCIPWFAVPDARWRDHEHEVIFGHWAMLGLYHGDQVLGLDTGCVWGGWLTAVRLDDGEIFKVPSKEGIPPFGFDRF